MARQKLQKKNSMVQKKSKIIWDLDINNIAISKLVEEKNNSKYIIGYGNKVKNGNKDKSNKLMSFCIDNEKLLEKYKTIGLKLQT